MRRFDLASLYLSIWLLATITSQAASFRNLGFDEADISNVGPLNAEYLYGPVEGLVPGWKVSDARIDTVTSIRYNTFPAGLGYIGIAGAGNDLDFPYEGRFSLAAGGAFITPPGGQGTYYPIAISQTGTIPEGAKTLRYTYFNDPWDVYVNGTQVSVAYKIRPTPDLPSGKVANAFPYGYAYADISRWAGKEAELTLVTKPLLRAFSGLDSIEFLPYAVIPEPQTWGLLAFGGGLWLLAHARKLRIC